MKKTFIFDYDDTLAPNHHDYTSPQLQLIEWVIKTIGPRAPDAQAILNLHVDIDDHLVKEMGHSMQRFPTSFVKTYQEICMSLHITPSQSAADEVYDIGMIAFDPERYKQNGLFEGATRTLDFLLEKGDELLLLTKGDREVQQRKIAATNMYKWFGDSIYIEPRKDKEIVLKYVGSRDKKTVWHVGNTKKSDINPALEAGINAIYIPLETWQHEKKDNKLIEVHDGKLLKYENIIDIAKHYDEIQ